MRGQRHGGGRRPNGPGYANSGPGPFGPGMGPRHMMGDGPDFFPSRGPRMGPSPGGLFPGSQGPLNPQMLPPQHPMAGRPPMGGPMPRPNLPPPPMRGPGEPWGAPGGRPAPNPVWPLQGSMPQPFAGRPQPMQHPLNGPAYPTGPASGVPAMIPPPGGINHQSSVPLELPSIHSPQIRQSGPSVQFSSQSQGPSQAAILPRTAPGPHPVAQNSSASGVSTSNGGSAEDSPMGPAERPKVSDPSKNGQASADKEDEDEKQEKFRKAWAMHKTDEGKEYYYNSLTSESSWVKPEGFSGEEIEEARPVSQMRVPETNWFEVHCEDGRKYFYNDGTQETSWTEPKEVTALKARVKEAKLAPVLAALPPPKTNGVSKDPKQPKDARPLKRGREIEAIIPGVTQPPLPTEVPPPMPPPERPQIRSRESLSADFMDLLTEKKVTPFSLWEKELPKLISDPRYLAVSNMKDRRAMFEEFCKKGPKRQKLESNPEVPSIDESTAANGLKDFQTLLEESSQRKDGAGLTPASSYTHLEEQYSSDPRWQACSEEDRQSLFAKHVSALKQKEEQSQKRSHALLISDFRSLLIAQKISGSSRWSKTKDSLAKDPRYLALPHASREQAFRDFVSDQKKLEDQLEKERLEREKKERSLKERLQRDKDEAESRQRKAAHADAVANYTTLLNEMVKDVSARWSEWRPRLERDPQGRANNPALSSSEAEQRFKGHVLSLQKKGEAAFVKLMDQVLRPLLPASKAEELPSSLKSFSKAEKLWQDDTRAVRLSSRDRERLFRRFVEELILERDQPEKLLQRTQLASRGRAIEQAKSSRNNNEGTDKAYEREYLAPDRKRLQKS